MSSPDKKKVRKKNFSEQEILVLCDFVKSHREKLFGRAGHCSQKVEDRKKKCWEQAALSLRAAGGVQRSWVELKKKWSDLKSLANKYKSHMLATGGGPAAQYNTVYEAVLEAMAPQARDGVTAVGQTETDPLLTSAMAIESHSQSLQDTPSSSPSTCGRQLTPHEDTIISPPQLPDSPLQQMAPPQEPSSSHRSEMKHGFFQEEILHLERARLEMSREHLKVQQSILSVLEKIAAGLCSKENEQ